MFWFGFLTGLAVGAAFGFALLVLMALIGVGRHLDRTTPLWSAEDHQKNCQAGLNAYGRSRN